MLEMKTQKREGQEITYELKKRREKSKPNLKWPVLNTRVFFLLLISGFFKSFDSKLLPRKTESAFDITFQ